VYRDITELAETLEHFEAFVDGLSTKNIGDAIQQNQQDF
jgi:hypothetical protein